MNSKDMKFCPVCGAEMQDEFEFCPECGYDFKEKSSVYDYLNLDGLGANPLKSRLAGSSRDTAFKYTLGEKQKSVDGIIFTNTARLADKYSCSLEQVYEVIADFIRKSEKKSVNWILLDVKDYSVNLESFEDHNHLLSQFIAEEGLVPGADLAVMIVGGEDVIPIPGIEDPYEKGEGVIPSDMYYSFDGEFLPWFINDGYGKIEIESVRNTIARLPLEDGTVVGSIDDDLGRYFNSCIDFSDGIPVGSVVMSSNAEWIPASATMSQHLPLTYVMDDPEMICNGMFISPKLSTEDEATMKIFRKSIGGKDTGMLIFNLHGTDDRFYSGFYSSEEAFSIDCLKDTSARVFNTVACYGARYNGYERNESMLLSALYESDVLLYTGSLVCVPMFTSYEGDEARELLLNPGTGSEVLMRLYSLYQFKGMPAGKALLQAKCDYFNMCRHVESDSFSMSTILMFSLYGNPLLNVRERPDVIQSALNNDAMPASPVKSYGHKFSKTNSKILYSRNGVSSFSLLEQVRDAVDENLMSIRSAIERNLYETLGLPSENLIQIRTFERTYITGRTEKGYTFGYLMPDRKFSPEIDVEVDCSGKIKKIFSSK